VVSTRPERTATTLVRRGLAKAGVLGTAVLLSGCTVDEALRMGMPQPATKEAPIIEQLWIGSWIAAWIVGALVWGLIIAAVVLYRRRPNDGMPKQTKYNVPIEFLYTVAPLIMILVLATFTWRDQAELTKLTSDYTHTVNVVGFRWSWGFNYVEEGVYDVGTPSERPTLWLPVDERTRFELVSPDVNHGFWVPDFLFKMDVIPGRMNKFELTPNKLGTFAGKCTELCGLDHARMLFDVKVVSRAEYDAHIADLKTKGQTGVFAQGRISTKAGVTA
jgi:cytochrome c oxidase subunit 2